MHKTVSSEHREAWSTLKFGFLNQNQRAVFLLDSFQKIRGFRGVLGNSKAYGISQRVAYPPLRLCTEKFSLGPFLFRFVSDNRISSNSRRADQDILHIRIVCNNRSLNGCQNHNSHSKSQILLHRPHSWFCLSFMGDNLSLRARVTSPMALTELA